MKIPRQIYLYWNQGWEQAPDLVKRCAETWPAHNPSWNVFFLDRSSVEERINIPYLVRSMNLPLPALSDVLRLILLKHHGGVWADATLWCARPLDDWIDDVCQKAGFFAYDKPGSGRPVASWFLAAIPNSRIVSLWHSIMMRFLLKAKLSSIFGIFGECLFSCLMPQLKGLSVPTSDLPDVENYFWIHKLFQICIDNDPEFRNLWLSVPKISADGPHKLQPNLLSKPIDIDALDHIQSMKANMYKLNRRIEIPSDISGTLLDVLYCSHSSTGDSRTTCETDANFIP